VNLRETTLVATICLLLGSGPGLVSAQTSDGDQGAEAADQSGAATAAGGQAEDEAEPFVCKIDQSPVLTLDYGSRYTEDSESRSDLDAEADRAVTEALRPVDDFISALADAANIASEAGTDSPAAAECVIAAVHEWASGDALADLQSDNAKLSVPSRIAGIGLAYLQVKPLVTDESRIGVIDTWLQARTADGMAYFDEDAPPMASRNNLRAWAGLAATAVGKATDDQALLDWGAETVRLISCDADSDGALPEEMKRGKLALHYHLHAVAPLVISAALLKDEHPELFEECDRALHRVVAFVPMAFNDPELVESKAGEPQSFAEGDDELQSFELAWADAYLSLFDEPAIADFVSGYRPLSNSKLGGRQEVLW
jgi:poly(beta-D-mannuronate) lyase